MTASELPSKPPVTPGDLVARASADLAAGDPLGAQTAALVAIAAALTERVGPDWGATVQELADLPDGAVVLDTGGLAWQRVDDFATDVDHDGWFCVLGDGLASDRDGLHDCLPALLISHPAWRHQ